MDINSIRKRLNQFRQQIIGLQTYGNHNQKQIIRVLPYKHNKDNPFIELFFHLV